MSSILSLPTHLYKEGSSLSDVSRGSEKKVVLILIPSLELETALTFLW